jgi:hypothetical protein
VERGRMDVRRRVGLTIDSVSPGTAAAGRATLAQARCSQR